MKPSQLGVRSSRTDMSFKYTADLLAAIFTWGGVGFLVDRWLDTSPVFMVIGFMVGNLAGVYLLYIRARNADPASPTGPEPARSEPDPT